MEFPKIQKEIYNPISENVKKLAELFPSAVRDGQVDFEALKKELGEFEAVSDKLSERYELGWAGKEEAKQLANTDVVGKTLKYIPEDSKNSDTTENLYIEGDNLEVLKLLRNSYYNKIKMIYIDPPYNTGNDFIYRDHFAVSEKENCLAEGELDEAGERLIVNQKSSGKYHSNWLSMMYPRLRVAKDLLAEDGVIFISIDDNEVANLRKICDEVFGENGFCGCFIWEKKKKPSFLNTNMGTITDHILVYAKNRQLSPPFVAGAVEDGKKYPFNNAGNGIKTLTFPPASVTFKIKDQLIKAQDMSGGNIKTVLLDDVIIKNGTNVNTFRLEGEWRYSQQKLDEFVDEKAEIVVSKVPFRPNYINRSGEPKKTANLLSYRTNAVPTNEDATEEIRTFFATDVISYPKPSGLIKYLVRAVTLDNALVLDFFAGSATTAHAVMQLNAEDGGNRKFIMVQLPEPCDEKSEAYKAGFKNISEIGKERIRRAGEKIKEENKDKEGIEDLDIGFKVFKVADTNIRWFSEALKSGQMALDEAMMTDKDKLDFNPGFTDIDVVYEILLRHRDIPLSANVEKLASIGARTYIFADTVVVCLEENITERIIDQIAALEPMPTKVIFRDSAFGDDISLKTNSMLRLEAQMKKHSGLKKKAYRVEFI